MVCVCKACKHTEEDKILKKIIKLYVLHIEMATKTQITYKFTYHNCSNFNPFGTTTILLSFAGSLPA